VDASAKPERFLVSKRTLLDDERMAGIGKRMGQLSAKPGRSSATNARRTAAIHFTAHCIRLSTGHGCKLGQNGSINSEEMK
jgi:hypothetical protein